MHSRSETARASSGLAKTLALTLALSCLSLAAGCATQENTKAQAQDDSNFARGLFRRNCAVCHGPDGEGKQIGTLSVPSLRAGRAATDPDERLFRQIHDGGNGMPPFKFTLTDEQIGDLLRFVRGDLQGRAASEQ
jgi:mono/diheme cytochrome c family protein